MSNVTVIEVMGWTDNDFQYTKALMVSEFIYNVKDLITAFMEKEKSCLRDSSKDFSFNSYSSTSFSIRGLDYRDHDSHADNFVFFLRKFGFKNLLEESTVVDFSD